MLQLRRYRAPTMAAAVLKAKADLGVDAVILEVRPVPARGLLGLLGHKQVEVTALAGLPEPAPPAMGAELAKLHHQVRDLRARLEAASRSPRPWSAYDGNALRALLAPVAPTRVPPGGRRVVALVGPTGSGKTTTVARLAAHFVRQLGRRVGILNADSFRAGAWAQMREQARRLGVPVRECNTPADAAAALADLAACQLVVVDTAGTGFREEGRLQELQQLLAALAPDEVHLVIPLNTHESHALAVLEAYRPVGVNRLTFTKADEADGPAVIEAVRACCDVPCAFLTCGPGGPGRVLEPWDPELRGAVGA